MLKGKHISLKDIEIYLNIRSFKSTKSYENVESFGNKRSYENVESSGNKESSGNVEFSGNKEFYKNLESFGNVEPFEEEYLLEMLQHIAVCSDCAERLKAHYRLELLLRHWTPELHGQAFKNHELLKRINEKKLAAASARVYKAGRADNKADDIADDKDDEIDDVIADNLADDEDE